MAARNQGIANATPSSALIEMPTFAPNKFGQLHDRPTAQP
jgi:hypothetical protein